MKESKHKLIHMISLSVFLSHMQAHNNVVTAKPIT